MPSGFFQFSLLKLFIVVTLVCVAASRVPQAVSDLRCLLDLDLPAKVESHR